MPTYTFRITQELLWYLAVTALTPVLLALAELDIDTITDWRAWGMAIVAASVRAFVAALLAKLGPGGFAAS